MDNLTLRVFDEAATPEERLAAVAHELALHFQDSFSRIPDYADFRDALRPYLVRELLMVRIDEARVSCGRCLTDRVANLNAQLVEISTALPKERRNL